MNRLQEIIANILESPVSEREKLDLIGKANRAKTEDELNQAILQVADYFDSLAGQFEEKSAVYEKYIRVFDEMNQEVAKVSRKYQKTE